MSENSKPKNSVHAEPRSSEFSQNNSESTDKVFSIFTLNASAELNKQLFHPIIGHGFQFSQATLSILSIFIWVYKLAFGYDSWNCPFSTACD